MRIDFTLEDAEAIDEILNKLRNGNAVNIESDKMSDSEYSRYKLYAQYIEQNKLAKYVGHYIGGVTNISIIHENGITLLERGGLKAQLLKEQQKENIASEIERLTKENLELQNNELKYKDKIRVQESIIRWWQVATAIAGLLGVLLVVLGYIL